MKFYITLFVVPEINLKIPLRGGTKHTMSALTSAKNNLMKGIAKNEDLITHLLKREFITKEVFESIKADEGLARFFKPHWSAPSPPLEGRVAQQEGGEAKSVGNLIDGTITLPVDVLRRIEFQKNYERKNTQEDFYRMHGAEPEIVDYAGENNKVFGASSEKISREWFKMDKPTSSCHDHTKCGKTVEQKSMRLGAKGNEGKWQHIEIKHEWDYLLLCSLKINGFDFHITSRSNVETLIKEGVITGQGKQNENGVAEAQQGLWFEKKDFEKKGKLFTDYFKGLTDEGSLIDYIQSTS